MSIISSFRRISQKMGESWHRSFEYQSRQIAIIDKLYNKYGLEIRLTCPSTPEQYEVFKGDIQIGYYRLRNGEFSVCYKDDYFDMVLVEYPNGDGMFDTNERLSYLTKALRALLIRIQNTGI